MPKTTDIDKIDKNAAKNIADLLALQTGINKDIENDMYGTTSQNIDLDDTKNKIATITSEFKQSIGGNFFDSLKNMKSDFSDRDKKKIEEIKTAITNNKNVSMFQNLINSNYSLTNKYEDLMLVTSIIPQLKQAKTAIVNSILSPDDFTKQIALNMMINEESLSTKNNALYKTINNNILKKYKFTELMKYITDRTVTFGSYSVAVLPYSKLFKEMIDRKNSRSSHQQTRLFSESYECNLHENTMIKNNITDVGKLEAKVNKLLGNITITNEASNLFDEEVLLQEYSKQKDGTKQSIFDLSKFNKDKVKQNIQSNNKEQPLSFNTASDGLYNGDGKNTDDVKITGCKIKKLDPRRLLSLKIDEDTCLGHYYFENTETMNAIQNSGMFSFKDNILNTNAQTTVDVIYKSIGDMLWQKLDHKFVENHPDIKEKLYDILQYSDVNADSKLKITFLEADEVVEFKINNGESAFESALFFSRLYLMVLLSTITARVIRANDVRAYYVDVDAEGGVNSMLYNAIDTLQRQNQSILGMNHVSKIISAYSVFEDLFIPKTKDDRKPIDFDIISGQQIDMNSDLLELLEQICVNSSGVPLLLLQNSNDVDFARTFTMMNMTFMKTTLDRQTDINPSVTELIKKILLTELTSDDDIAIINNLECYLQSPMNLLLTNILEQINNAKDVAQSMIDVIGGQDGANTFGQAALDALMLEICKKYAPNVPFAEFKEMLDTLAVKIKKDNVVSGKDDVSGGSDTILDDGSSTGDDDFTSDTGF
jgi:hypothetical protein